MAKALKTVAPKTTKCPAALLGRQLCASIQGSYDRTDNVRTRAEQIHKANPSMPWMNAVSEAEEQLSFAQGELRHQTRLTDVQNYLSHVRATSIEGALSQIAVAIDAVSLRRQDEENNAEAEALGRIVRNLVSAFYAIEHLNGFAPDGLISQHYVSRRGSPRFCCPVCCPNIIRINNEKS